MNAQAPIHIARRMAPEAMAKIHAASVIRIDRTAEAIRSAASAAMSAGNWSAAADSWATLRGIAPDDIAGFVRGADALWKAGRQDDAEALAVAAISRFPESNWAAHFFADLAGRCEDWPEASRRWADVRRRFPDDASGYVNGAATLIRADEFDEADALSKAATTQFPERHEPWMNLAELAMRRHDWEMAIARWTALQSRFPDEPAAYVRGGQALIAAGRAMEASDLARDAVARFPQNLWVHHFFCEALFRCEAWAEAAEHLAAMRTNFPDDLTGYMRGVVALERAGETELADAVAEEGARRFPQHEPLALIGAELATRSKNWDVAHERWLRMRVSFPDSTAAWLGLANLARSAGKPDDASDILARAAIYLSPSAALLEARLENAIERGDWHEARCIWNYGYQGSVVVGELFYTLTWKIYLSCINTPQSKTLLTALLGEPAVDRPHWLPKIVIALHGVLADDGNQFHRIVGDIVTTLRDDGMTWLPHTVLVELICGIKSDYATVASAIERYLPTQNQILFNLFCKMRRRSPKVAASYEKILDHLVSYLGSRVDTVDGFHELDGNSILNLILLCYIFNKKSFYKLTRVLRAKLSGSDSADFAASLGAAVDAVSSIARLTVLPEDAKSAGATLSRSLDRPLRIAVCVSGQLRGYQRAKPTWNLLGLQDHNVTYFVHTWGGIGRRFPLPAHAQRSFSGDFLAAYLRLFDRLDLPTLEGRYPGFFAFFRQGDHVTIPGLQDFYKTDHVIIEDDRSDKFKYFSNPMKMYYKISAAHGMAKSISSEFDLYVRIRPDKEIRASVGIDWHRVRTDSIYGRQLQCDMAPMTSAPGLFEIGDQFAVGCREVMDIYCSAWEFTKNPSSRKLLGFPQTYLGHENVAACAFYHGVAVDALDGVTFGGELDPGAISPAQIKQMLLDDIGPVARDDIDRMLLAACDTADLVAK